MDNLLGFYFYVSLHKNRIEMNYMQFRNRLYELGCFHVHQVYAWQPAFDKSNLTRWVKTDLLVKLRNGWYAFPEYRNQPDFTYFISNRIYRPSYISLHTALAFYGMIPEGVVQVSAVGTLKKARFENVFGTFIYQKIASGLMFGYDAKPVQGGRNLLFAQPEKALLDLLYLYPFYNTPQEMEELRLDEDFMQQDFNVERFREYAGRFQSKSLSKRAELLLNVYELKIEN
jgi:predicted transcriptional regulator of viral defense system